MQMLKKYWWIVAALVLWMFMGKKKKTTRRRRRPAISRMSTMRSAYRYNRSKYGVGMPSRRRMPMRRRRK